MATKRARLDDVPHKGKPLRGKASKKDVASFEPSEAPGPLAAAVTPPRRPRPARTRYPISMSAYAALKERASRSKNKPPKLAATVVADRAGKQPELAAAPVAMETALLEPAAPPAATPVAVGNFAGISATGFIPPDCAMAAGPEHVLLAVNNRVSIYGKTGGAPKLSKTLTQWFSNVISNATIFDPKALWDQHAGRWVLLAVAVPAQPGQTGSWFLLSISKTADPIGGWWNHKLDAALDGVTPTSNWADYPGLGVDAFNVYLTANMFEFDNDFAYAKIRVVNKLAPYNGIPATWLDFVPLRNADGSLAFTVQPCHTYGAPGVQYFVNSYYPTPTVPFPKKLTLWSLPTVLPLTLSLKTITTIPFGLPPDAKQGGGGKSLDTGDIRVLNAVFRGGSVWGIFTTSVFYTSNVAGFHWFQINPTSGALIQKGVFGAPGKFYFYPALMPDTNGNMIVCFSRSSSTEFASIYYTGRKSADPLGSLQTPSVLLKAGTNNYVSLDSGGQNRWGDYTGVAIDPGDQRTVWFYNEFAVPNNSWATWVGRAKF